MSSLNIPVETLHFLDSLVAQGEYASRDAAVVAAVDQMRRRRQKLQELRDSIEEAINDPEPARPVALEEILTEARRVFAQRREQS
jgi:putative addiction module CopG family antidote